MSSSEWFRIGVPHSVAQDSLRVTTPPSASQAWILHTRHGVLPNPHKPRWGPAKLFHWAVFIDVLLTRPYVGPHVAEADLHKANSR